MISAIPCPRGGDCGSPRGKAGTGTFTGKFGDTEPTGKMISMSHANFSRYENGKCVEVVRFGDSLAFYQQAGVTPPTG